MKTVMAVLLALPLTALAQTVVVTAQPNSFTPTTVVTSTGTYIVVPNYSTGGTAAVIQTSTAKPANPAPKK